MNALILLNFQVQSDVHRKQQNFYGPNNVLIFSINSLDAIFHRRSTVNIMIMSSEVIAANKIAPMVSISGDA
jgi:hypothetical protein